jgi:anti-sigma B factor antagonist
MMWNLGTVGQSNDTFRNSKWVHQRSLESSFPSARVASVRKRTTATSCLASDRCTIPVGDPPRNSMLIEVERQEDVCILRLEGRFVTGTDPYYLHAKIEELKSQGCTKVLADLRELLSIGSTGIGFLVRAYSTVTKTGNGRFAVVCANLRVLEVFELTHLKKAMAVVPDITSGLALLRAERVDQD